MIGVASIPEPTHHLYAFLYMCISPIFSLWLNPQTWGIFKSMSTSLPRNEVNSDDETLGEMSGGPRSP